MYPLLAAGGWLTALAVIAAALARDVLRDPTGTIEAGPRDAFLAGMIRDPAGLGPITRQVPRFVKPESGDVDAWIAWQEQLSRYLAEEVYDLDVAPSAVAAPRIIDRRESSHDGLRRIDFGIVAPDGDAIPAVMLLPSLASPAPAILFVPGHVRDDESGLEQLVRDADSYQHAAARELALAGFATLTIELRGFGLRGPPAFPDHHVVAHNALLADSFYKKVVFADVKAAFDYLLTVPEVDPDRVGVSGASLGGELAVEYAAMDPRVKAISFHSHSAGVGPYTGEAGTGRAPHYCHIIPGANGFMHQEDPFLLLAPRPTQGIRGEEQPFRNAAFVQSLERLWSLMGRPDALEIDNEPGGHVYFVEPAIRFFREHL